MAKIVSKLNLNKTPQLVENNSLIFAKNIKLLKDGSIGPDFAVQNIFSIVTSTNKYGVIGQIVGVNNKIYLFVEANDESGRKTESCTLYFPRYKPGEGSLTSLDLVIGSYTYSYSADEELSFQDFLLKYLQEVTGESATITESEGIYTLTISHCLKDNLNIYWLQYYGSNRTPTTVTTLIGTGLDTKIEIIEYTETTGFKRVIESGWTYHGGTITGNVTVNNTNEEILTICESDAENDVDIPIKHINLARCSSDDDESIYTQAPNIPVTNLTLLTTYTKTIPNGVYQFFIRYKIRENFYTSWFPCSKECFAGTSKIIKTIQGQLKYINTHTDASKSFIFKVEHLFNGINDEKDYTKNFINYQIGFIISHDDAVNARAWKSFEFSTNEIYFDYDEDSITEVDIDEMVKTNYELFNVKNIAYFKNKLYISNYKETNFNPDFNEITKNISVELVQKRLDVDGVISIGGNQLSKTTSTYGDDVYDKWGGQNIINLFVSSYYNTISDTESSGTKYDSKDKDYGVLYLHTILDYDIDPDLLWINEVYSDEAGVGFPNWTPRTKPTDFRYSGCLTQVGYGWCYYDNLTHPLSKYYAFKYKWWWQGGSSKNNVYAGNGNSGKFYIYDNGMDKSYDSAITHFMSAATSMVSTNCPTMILTAIYIIYNNTKYYLIGSETACDTEDACDFTNFGSFGNTRDLKEYAKTSLKNKIIGVTSDGEYVAYIHNSVIKFETYIIAYSEFTYTTTKEVESDTSPFKCKIRVDSERTNKTINCNIKVNSRYIHNSYVESQHNTLMPFTDYDFYIHYVKDNGIPTNGYFINKVKLETYSNEDGVNIVYPKFHNINIPDGYSSCFISIYKSGNDICRGFNHELNADGYHYIDCLEADTLLYNLNDGITIIDSNGNEVASSSGEGGKVAATYYSSGTTDPISLFGNSGCIRWPKSNDEYIYYSSIADKTFNVDTSKSYSKLFFNIVNSSNVQNSYSVDCSEKTQSTLIELLEELKTIYPGLHYTVSATDTETIFSITIGTNNENTSVKALGLYYSTDDSENGDLLAKQATVAASAITDTKFYWVKVNSKVDTDNNKRLVKLTPYIKPTSGTTISEYDNYNDMNMPGFVNKIYKLDRSANNSIYCSGTDIYTKTISTDNVIELDSYTQYQPLATSVAATVPSNFNLNYCSLSEDLTPQLRTFKASESETSSMKQMITVVQSLTCSYILELASMYKDYDKKYYSVYNSESITEFNNTIRSSDANTDEMYRNIYYFNSEDYYNTPTNRGAIINVFNIVNSIYVHTEHSLFKFSGANTLSSENGDVNMKESEVFDTGITEVFDSQFGYAGLQVKHQSLVTFNSYVFYDKLANVIYAYGGDAQIISISDPIQKILDWFDVTDVLFVADDRNDRFFVNLKSSTDNICLSYNFKTKSFISVHDIDFSTAFNTRSHVYFVNATEERYNIYQDNPSSYNYYAKLFTKSALFIEDMTYPSDADNYDVENCVDIICNDEYEIIKNIEYINWICSAIVSFDTSDNVAEEELNTDYSGTKIKIYSDQCSTGIIKLIDENGNPKVQNTKSLSDPNSYKYPRYNCGIWSLNYFRDIKNSESDDYSDSSLIYGKYFVVRFIFNNKNFKLENINLRSNNYGKV